MKVPNGECRMPITKGRVASSRFGVRTSEFFISSVFIRVVPSDGTLIRFAHLRFLLLLAALTGLAVAKGPVPDLLGSLNVATPVKHANLTVFPLTGASSVGTSFLTLDKAVTSGQVKVQEKDGGEVNKVRVKNTSDRYVFGMAGEIITGAKQNRMLEKDVLLPPKSGWLDVSVYCVEHGRWQGASLEFSSKGQIAAGRVRGKAANTQSQAGVWDEVRANNAELGIVAETDRFDAVFEDKKVQKDLASYKSALADKVPKLGANVLGVAVAVGDRLVCCDVFGSNALFAKMWPRLLESYVVDAISCEPSGSMSRKEVTEFLKNAAGARTVQQPTVGAGHLVRIEGDDAAGQALVFNQRVVHLDLFSEDEGSRSPLRLDIRRQGIQR